MGTDKTKMTREQYREYQKRTAAMRLSVGKNEVNEPLWLPSAVRNEFNHAHTTAFNLMEQGDMDVPGAIVYLRRRYKKIWADYVAKHNHERRAKARAKAEATMGRALA